MKEFAGIIVNNEAIKLDKLFTYRIPNNLIGKLSLGHRVKVPFGMGNKYIDGFVLKLYSNDELNLQNKELKRIKNIKEICDDFPLIRENDIELIEIMREKYLCTYLEAIKVMIPNGITKGMKFKTKDVVSINNPLQEKYLKENYMKIYDFIKNSSESYTKAELSREQNFSISSINTLIKHGFLKVENVIDYRYNNKEYKIYPGKVLNSKQQSAVNNILNSCKSKFLIHGVTGSGKTEIYMNLVNDMLKKGKDSIILIPEISLTPQMVERFKGRFGKDIAIFHSKLNDGEKFDEWMRVKSGKVKVAIGARSAIFLPFKNLGLIVIDEEHEGSYKSDSDPKYIAKEIGELKSNIEGCKLVLGSATPSVESYYKGKINEYEIITLDKRADNAELPKIYISDMRVELNNGNKSIFSKELYESIKEALEKKEQIILFLNRRGYSTFVSCRSCGYVFKCHNCDISLTYHNSYEALTCHYCGSKAPQPKICPKCKSKYVKHFGIGTEQLEMQVKKNFPNAKTIRVDFDTTRGKNSYEKLYNSFKNGDADILIGTQMIAKGLDFENVTLVGVIAADLSLNIPDYRSKERTFQLITQVAGRAGRGKKEGKVVIQTYNPEVDVIKYSAENNYEDFFKNEIMIRKILSYPPFTRILCINFSSTKEDLLIKKVHDISNKIKLKLKDNKEVKILGPCPCGISKIKNLYRWQLILKGEFNNHLGEKIKDFIYEQLNDVYNDIKVSIDINPNNML